MDTATQDRAGGLAQGDGAMGSHPTDPSIPGGDAATAGATRAGQLQKTQLPPETIAEKVRNALMILNAGGREAEPVIDQGAPDGPEAHNALKYRIIDIADMQRLLSGAAAQDDAQVIADFQVRQLLARAGAEIKKLNLVIDEQHKRDASWPIWTTHTFQCLSCRNTCRATKQSIDAEREANDHGAANDAEIAAAFEFCLSCVNGVYFPEERVTAVPSA